MNYQILHGDCLEMLRTLPDESAHCCVTSPPYYGLRDYGTADWEGGDPGCDHAPGGASRVGRTTLQGGKSAAGHQQEGYRGACGKCGAVRVDQQIGLEETPEQYVAALVAVFREVRRVLRADGTLWLNLGDSYAGSGRGNNPNGKQGTNKGTQFDPDNSGFVPVGLKPKDLIGIPWRVAFALQADGWWLRQDIIWSKPNPMPESVTDRCTKAHEYVFLLSKSARYYYDAAAVAEASVDPEDDRKARSNVDQKRMFTDSVAGIRPGSATYPTRNRRSVWTITTKPYRGAHYATMPPDLAKLCILAGCPAGGRVLDPFSGSGTTVSVAISLGRAGIGIELSPANVELSHNRIGATQPALLGV